MTNYVLEWSDGRTSEIIADSDSLAIREACDLIGENAVVASEWDQAGQNDDDLTNWRLLIWRDDAVAKLDATGAKAVAQLTVCCAGRPVA